MTKSDDETSFLNTTLDRSVWFKYSVDLPITHNNSFKQKDRGFLVRSIYNNNFPQWGAGALVHNWANALNEGVKMDVFI